MTPDVEVIGTPAPYTRLTARGLKSRGEDATPVDRTGGKFGAGVIRGVSVITRGEALGHRAWIDNTALQQVADAINATGDKGLKSRFTHPDMSGDGLGKVLGRAFGPAEVVNGQVIADGLHFHESAHATPSGDLAGYVMGLAEEDPESFGTSIVFEHDRDAEDAFYDANQQEVESANGRGRKGKRYEFRSPDPDNVNHYYHIRIAALRAVDAVDDPAANPGGLFHRGAEIPQEADELLSFALGLTDAKPESSMFGIEAERASAYVSRFLESRGLEVRKPEKMADNKPAEPTPATVVETKPSRADFAAELGRYVEAFGAEKGAKWCAEGKPFADCYAEHSKDLAAKLAAETEKRTAAEKALAEVKLGEPKPVSTPDAGGKKGFASAFRIAGSN